jgi:hypothetical protein
VRVYASRHDGAHVVTACWSLLALFPLDGVIFPARTCERSFRYRLSSQTPTT